MPELPEVETIVRQLQRRVRGKPIAAVKVLNTQVVDAGVRALKGNSIVKAFRRAKAIVLELGGERYLLVRLGMTGHFHYFPNGKISFPAQERKYIMVRFHFTDGSALTFNEVRKFGSMRLLSKKQVEQELAKLGPEPLAKDFTLRKFTSMLAQKGKANLKVTLMDQHFIAGIGNIYAQELLYHARISPQRTIASLSQHEIKKLYNSLRQVLQKAVQKQGTTVQDYVHIDGSGGFQKYLTVYGQTKCPKKHPITKIRQGGRGTYYCSRCQL